MSGELKKLKITAYTGTGDELSLSQSPDDTYIAQVNPETYTINYQVNLNTVQAQNTSGKDVGYVNTPPPTLQFDFLFDGTGVLPKPNNLGILGDIPLVGAIADALLNSDKEYDVMAEIAKFNHVIFDYDGDQHSPKKIQLLWGKLIFDGKLNTLNYNFKMFKPDGSPLRAVARATFIGTVTDNLRVKKEKANSPDLTHVREVKEGDTLPLMAYNIYGDASYYLEVARVNNITNFRRLIPGDKIYFPPLNKANK